jgi:hypothetical protein
MSSRPSAPSLRTSGLSTRRRLAGAFPAIAVAVLTAGSLDAIQVEVLRSVGGLPPHIVGTFENAIAYQQASNGSYYVFDRGGHAVYTVDAGRKVSRKVVDIGQEEGRIIQPTGFDMAPDGRFVVADVPRAQQRLQTFGPAGERVGGFFLPGRPAARIILGNLMLNGAGSVQHAGDSLLLSHPESGSLFTEYSLGGYARRSIGAMRTTGFEADRDLHVAMNAGVPLVDPTGGFYYVFITGTPMFRKYDAAGAVVFERHIQGRELDAFLAAQPSRWPRRRVEDREVPFVTPVIRAAAVDPAGQLWISLGVPYTYVYDTQGDKTRTVQFEAAGVLSPTSLFFSGRGRLLVTPGCYEFDPTGR